MSREVGSVPVMRFNVARLVNYRNFGFLPTGSIIRDLYGKLFGHRNLLKRLQAPAIITALSPRPDDVILDFGCGAGYITVEIAKGARKAVGVDRASAIRRLKVPPTLEGRLEFRESSGDQLPFVDSTFDKVLLSEVLCCFDDPGILLREVERVLKPGGSVVICIGTGRPAIEAAFADDRAILKILRLLYRERMPASYADYGLRFNQIVQNAWTRFLTEDEICRSLEESGFRTVAVQHTPGAVAGTYLSWLQFVLYLRTGRLISQSFFALQYFPLRVLDRLSTKPDLGGLLCVGECIKR